MEEAHRRVIGFQMIAPKEPIAEHDELLTLPRQDRSNGPYKMAGAGIGRIPTMPRPKFLSALTNFALGE
jgi:hypothetical protein